MARGRKPRTLLDELRARWWYRALRSAVACKHPLQSLTPNDLGQILRDERVWSTEESRQWYYYEKGERSPAEVVLKAVENFYPGTRRVFDHGPDFSYLWEALAGNPRNALSQTEDEWRHSVSVEHLIRMPERVGVNAEGTRERYPEQQGIQDVLVPKFLAERWGLVPGAQLNLSEKLRPWERLQDLCGFMVSEGFHTIYAAAAVLDLGPSTTFTKEERLKAQHFVRLPYFAGLAYQIAQARLNGQTELTVPPWSGLYVEYKEKETPQEMRDRISHEVEEYSKMWRDFEQVSGLKFKIYVGVRI